MTSIDANRRNALKLLGGLGALTLFGGCGSDEGNANSDTEGGSSGGSSAAGNASATGGTSSTSAAWASEGTSVLSGKDYGNPFADGIGTACTVYASATEGPCHATSDELVRKDISEGYPGLPTRLEFLLLDSDCNPLPGATLEIWHCDTLGVYSGDIDGGNDAMCTGGDAEAAAALWYRGIQTSGSDGRVTFDTNFPGWYASRATHIHFKVSVGSISGLVSQVFFEEALKSEIYDSQPNYQATSGAGYQPNAGDKVISEAGMSLDEVTMSVAKQEDGALLAWKAIVIAL